MVAFCIVIVNTFLQCFYLHCSSRVPHDVADVGWLVMRMYCGETARQLELLLGTEAKLSQCHIV